MAGLVAVAGHNDPVLIGFKDGAGTGNRPWTYVIHGLGTSLWTLWALRPNIQRLREGRERRVTFRRTSRRAQ